LASFLNEQLEKLASTFQLKVLNEFFLTRLHRALPSLIKDNETYLRLLCSFAVPEVFSKVILFTS
jgi:hypothetical protein